MVRPLDIDACVMAGRHTAINVLRENAISFEGNPALHTRDSRITVTSMDIAPMIDAVVLETIVRLQHPAAPESKLRPWQKVWRSYVETITKGWPVFLLICGAAYIAGLTIRWLS